ncbi:hypothetical protein ACNO7T_20980 [Vibrio campbellii]
MKQYELIHTTQDGVETYTDGYDYYLSTEWCVVHGCRLRYADSIVTPNGLKHIYHSEPTNSNTLTLIYNLLNKPFFK